MVGGLGEMGVEGVFEKVLVGGGVEGSTFWGRGFMEPPGFTLTQNALLPSTHVYLLWHSRQNADDVNAAKTLDNICKFLKIEFNI